MESALPQEVLREVNDALTAGDEDTVLRLVDARESGGSSAVARKVLEHALASKNDSRRVLVRYLEFLTRYKDWRRVDEVAASLDADMLQRVGVRFAIGCAYELQQRWHEAATSFRHALLSSPKDVEPLVRLTRALRATGKSAEALEILEAYKKFHRRDAPVFAALGYAKIETGNAQGAAACFRKAHALQPDWGPYLDDLAGALMLCEQWRDAALAASKSLTHRKKNERAWTVYAIAHQNLGVRDRAEQGFRNAIRAARDPSRANGNFGLFLRNDPERLFEAARLLRKAREAHPDWREVDVALKELLASES